MATTRRTSRSPPLSQHRGYVDLWDPAQPAHHQFPPGFPALLALALMVGLRPLVQLKLLVVASSVGAVAASAAALRRASSPPAGLAAAVVLALLPGVAAQTSWILADCPAWAALAVGWWAGVRYAQRPGARWWIASVLAFAAAVALRSASLAPVLGVVLWAAWHRHWKFALSLGAFVFAPAFAWSLSAGTEAPYSRAFWFVDPYRPEAGAASITEVLARLPENAARYAGDLLPNLLAPPLPGNVLGLVLLGLAVVGAWRTRRAAPLATFMVLPTIAVLLVWPTAWADARYLLPLLPWLLALAVEALPAKWPALALVGVAVLLGIPAHVRQDTRAAQCRDGAICLPPMWHEWFTIADEMRRGLPAGSVVLSRKPSLLFLIAGLPGRLYPMKEGSAALLDEATNIGARYVLADSFSDLSARYLWPNIAEAPDRFCIVRSGEQTMLLRIEPPGTVSPTPGQPARCP